MVRAGMSPILAYLAGVATVAVPVLVWAFVDRGTDEDER